MEYHFASHQDARARSPSAGVCCSEGQAYITEGFALTQMEKTKPAAALPWVTVARKFRS